MISQTELKDLFGTQANSLMSFWCNRGKQYSIRSDDTEHGVPSEANCLEKFHGKKMDKKILVILMPLNRKWNQPNNHDG